VADRPGPHRCGTRGLGGGGAVEHHGCWLDSSCRSEVRAHDGYPGADLAYSMIDWYILSANTAKTVLGGPSGGGYVLTAELYQEP
jgi:hypothetical protein